MKAEELFLAIGEVESSRLTRSERMTARPSGQREQEEPQMKKRNVSRILRNLLVAALIVSAQPFFVAVMAHLLVKNDRFTPLKVFSILLAIVGLVVVSFPSLVNMQAMGIAAIGGILLMLVNCLSAAYGNIIVSKVDFATVDIRVLNSAQLTLGGALLLALAAGTGRWQPLPAEGAFYITLAIMVFIAVATMVTWFSLLSRPEVKVSELNMWKFLIPVFGSLEGWLLVEGDTPNAFSVTGMILLTASLLLFYHRPLGEFFFRNTSKQ